MPGDCYPFIMSYDFGTTETADARAGPGRTSNLQPDRYERSALTIELPARRARNASRACSARPVRASGALKAQVRDPRFSPPVINDAGPLRLLRRWRQHSTIAMVLTSSGADMAEVAVSARSPKRRPMGAPQRNPKTPSSAASQDCPRICRRERISLVKNRMREFRTHRFACQQTTARYRPA